MLIEAATTFAQFGVAGLMGALWVWERMMSRKRDTQLNATHEKVMRQQQELRTLIRLVHRNTRAIEQFNQTQKQIHKLLEKINDEMPRKAA